METRLVVAYALIALVLLSLTVGIALVRYRSHAVQYRRRIRNEHRREVERKGEPAAPNWRG
jgi:hypothetical protein